MQARDGCIGQGKWQPVSPANLKGKRIDVDAFDLAHDAKAPGQVPHHLHIGDSWCFHRLKTIWPSRWLKWTCNVSPLPQTQCARTPTESGPSHPNLAQRMRTRAKRSHPISGLVELSDSFWQPRASLQPIRLGQS